jgi:pimeloyl-ACP methyl ester carboxylesterase
VPDSLSVNGIDVAYDAQGGGEPFILLHGWTGGRVDWAGVVVDLATRHRVITLDHRGHGDSTNTGDPVTYTFDQLAEDFSAFVDALGVERFDLLGHSMGGIVAMRYALGHPERLRSLILMDTGGAATPGSGKWMQPALDLVAAKGTDAFFEVAKSALGDGPAGDRARIEYKQKLAAMDPVAFVALGRELTTHPSMLDRLATLALPTTVIVGENDVGLRSSSDDLTAAIPDAVLDVIPDAAHSPQVENRSGWLAAVDRHFARSTNVA